MNVFEIVFIGLVCHVGGSEANKDFAAMLRADAHVVGAIVETGTSSRIEKGVTIEFSFDDGPLVRRHAVTDPSFDVQVPSVQKIMSGSILSKEALASVANLMYYPPSEDDDGDARPSTLTVCESYRCFGVHHIGGKVKRPAGRVAKAVRLRIESRAETLSVWQIKDGNKVPLAKLNDGEHLVFGTFLESEWTLVQQFPNLALQTAAFDEAEDCSTPDSGHFRHYGELLHGENSAVSVKAIENRAAEVRTCSESWVDVLMDFIDRQEFFVSTHIECGNTDYP